jgi:hypothetical protein
MNMQISTLFALAMALALVGCSTSDGTDSSSSATQPYMGKVHVIPGTIELEDFDEGG